MRRVSFVLTMVLTALPASAQVTDENTGNCAHGATDDIRINACTAVIQSGQLSAGDLAAAYVNRGVVYNRDGRPDEALADASRALSAQPDYANAYGVRATAYRKKEQYDQAIADDSSGIAVSGDPRIQSILYFDRGLSQEDKKLYDLALADMNKAIELKADSAIYYGGRARVYHRIGSDAQALPDAEKAATLRPADAGILETRAEIYEKLGRRNDAVAGYRAVLQIDSTIEGARDGLKRLGATP